MRMSRVRLSADRHGDCPRTTPPICAEPWTGGSCRHVASIACSASPGPSPTWTAAHVLDSRKSTRRSNCGWERPMNTSDSPAPLFDGPAPHAAPPSPDGRIAGGDEDRAARGALTWLAEPGHRTVWSLVQAYGAPATLDLLLRGESPDSALRTTVLAK